jgi:2-polyprenyl-3-methyl-5-hydroxy-6-metoxy-1,4-benzoquinol methylase
MDSLAPLYRQMADDGENFHGLSIWQYRREIGELVKKHQAKRLLDFGCGRGDAYRHNYKVHRDWGLKWFDIKLYDPAFEEHCEMPWGKYDGVLCSDVLEHIPEEEVDAFIARLFAYARTFVWASVCCRPAKKFFPDSRNLHVTVQPKAWWEAKFGEHAPEGIVWYLTETQ